MRGIAEMPGLRDRRLAAANQMSAVVACGLAGCPNTTSDGKPFCQAHLDRLPYVRKLKAELARRELEAAAAAKRWRALDPNGSRAGEVLEELAVGGAQTVERLAVKLRVPARALLGYARRLESAGRVKLLRLATRRGGTRRVVALVGATPALRSAS